MTACGTIISDRMRDNEQFVAGKPNLQQSSIFFFDFLKFSIFVIIFVNLFPGSPLLSYPGNHLLFVYGLSEFILLYSIAPPNASRYAFWSVRAKIQKQEFESSTQKFDPKFSIVLGGDMYIDDYTTMVHQVAHKCAQFVVTILVFSRSNNKYKQTNKKQF